MLVWVESALRFGWSDQGAVNPSRQAYLWNTSEVECFFIELALPIFLRRLDLHSELHFGW